MHCNYISASSLAVAGLATLTMASPMQKRQGADPTDKSDWCGLSEDLGSYDSAKKAYDYLSLESVLPVLANDKDWIQKTHDNLGLNIDPSGAENCQISGVTCEPASPLKGWKCERYFDEGEKDGKSPFEWKRAFWTFKAAQGIHDKVELMERALTKSVLQEHLQLETLITDFSPDDEAEVDAGNFMDWMSTGAAIGDQVLALSSMAGGPGVSLISGFGALLLSELPIGDEPAKNAIKIGEIQSTLGKYYESASSSLNKTLAYANGGDGKPDEMPSVHPSAHVRGEFPRGSMLATPIWLIANNSPDVRKLLASTSENVALKVLDTVIQAAGYALMWSGDDNESDCNKLGHAWIDAEDEHGEACFTMYQDRGDGWSARKRADDSIFKAMETHGLEGKIKEYYIHALRCSRSGGSASSRVDVQSALDGNFPNCFFSLPVKKVVKARSSVPCNPQWNNCLESEKSDTIGDFYDD